MINSSTSIVINQFTIPSAKCQHWKRPILIKIFANLEKFDRQLVKLYANLVDMSWILILMRLLEFYIEASIVNR